MKTARQVAFEALLKIHKDGAYSNLVIDSILSENGELDERDKAFVSNIVYGSLDRMILIDYNLGLYLNQPSKKVPNHAAVDESVQLAKVNKSAFAASLVNAVLRRVADNGLRYPDMDENSVEYLSIRYSCPDWLLKLWIDSYGRENAVAIAEKALDAAPVTVRTNTLKTDSEELIWKLAEEGVVAEKSDSVANALLLSNTGSVESLIAYNEGYFHAQDLSSQICCEVLDAKPGEQYSTYAPPREAKPSQRRKKWKEKA